MAFDHSSKQSECLQNTRLNSCRNRWFYLLGVLLLAGSLDSIPADITTNIDVAPNVLNLQNKGSVVIIHTDVAYSLVAGSTVSLNDIVIQSWKSDVLQYFQMRGSLGDLAD